MARLNLDRLKRKGKADEGSAKKARVELGSTSGARDPSADQIQVPPSGGEAQAPSGEPSRFISLTEDSAYALSHVLKWIPDEEVRYHENISGFSLVERLTFDAVKTLTHSFIVANRLMAAERHISDEEKKTEGVAKELEEANQRLNAALQERDSAREAERVLRQELATLKQQQAAEKASWASRAIESYKKSEAFQLELEECFEQAFEVARGRATLLFPSIDFSVLQPVDPAQTTVQPTGAAEGENEDDADSRIPPP